MLDRHRNLRGNRKRPLRRRFTTPGPEAVSAVPSRQVLHGGPRRALTVYADETFFDIDVALAYAAFPDLLSFETKLAGVRVPGPPRVTLSAEDDIHDVTVVVPVELDVLGTRHEVKVFIRGWIEIEDGIAQLGRLDVDVDAGNAIAEELLDSIFDRMVGAARRASMVRVPRLEKIFGRDIDARLVDAKVVEVFGRPMFQITATVGPDQGNPEPVPMPEALGRNPPPEGSGRLVVIVPEAVLNGLIDALLDDYVHHIRTKVGPKGTRLKLRGRIQVDEPRFTLRGGRIDARLKVGFRKIEAGLEVFGGTDWSKIRIKEVEARLGADLVRTDEGQDLTLVLGEPKGLEAKFKSGGGLTQELAEQAVDNAVGSFNRVLRSRLSGKRITLIDTPETILVSAHRVRVEFGADGPLIQDGTLVADLHFDIKGDNPVTDLAEYWQFQSLPGGQAHVIDRGAGQPVVFIPDLLGDVQSWNAQMDGLARWFRVVAYSWRGMGRSEGGAWPYRLGKLVRDLRQLLKELDLDRPVLVGQGMGARIAARYATSRNSNVGGLVCVAGAGQMFEPGCPIRLFQPGSVDGAQGSLSQRFFGRRMPLVMERFWSPVFMEREPDLIAAWKARYVEGRVLPALWATRAARGRLSMRRVAALQVPRAVIGGHDDGPAAKVAEEIGAEFLSVPGRSRMPMIEEPVAFNEALKGFVERHLIRS